MATITINIPVDKEAWVLGGLSMRFGYPDMVTNPNYDAQEFIPNPAYDDQIPEDPDTNPSTIPNPTYDPALQIANPQSKAAFVKENIIELLKSEATQGHIMKEWELKTIEKDTVTLT